MKYMKPVDWVFFFMIIICWITLALSLGCDALTSHDRELDLSNVTVYKRDMQICLNDKCAEGVIVAPRKSKYEFEIKAHGRLELFTFATCHREETTSKHSRRRWFKDNKVVKGTYLPVPGIEDGHCPVYIGGYNHKNRNSWAFADFEDPEYTISAKVNCNGASGEFNGVSVCQSRAGLIQTIEFPEVVTVDACGLKGKSNRFEYKIESGECVAVFFGAKSMHRLTTIGYDKILLRKK